MKLQMVSTDQNEWISFLILSDSSNNLHFRVKRGQFQISEVSPFWSVNFAKTEEPASSPLSL